MKMKKSIIILSVLALTFSSCKKEKTLQECSVSNIEKWETVPSNTNHFSDVEIYVRIKTFNCSGVQMNVGGFNVLNESINQNIDTVIEVSSQKTYNIQTSCSGSNILIEKRNK